MLDEIASKQMWLLKQHLPRGTKLQLPGVELTASLGEAQPDIGVVIVTGRTNGGAQSVPTRRNAVSAIAASVSWSAISTTVTISPA